MWRRSVGVLKSGAASRSRKCMAMPVKLPGLYTTLLRSMQSGSSGFQSRTRLSLNLPTLIPRALRIRDPPHDKAEGLLRALQGPFERGVPMGWGCTSRCSSSRRSSSAYHWRDGHEDSSQDETRQVCRPLRHYCRDAKSHRQQRYWFLVWAYQICHETRVMLSTEATTEVWNSQNKWWKSWRELWMGWSGRW